jgi:hemerythrin
MDWIRRADVPLVAIEFMDRDHREHVDRVNALGRLVERARAGEDVSGAIEAGVRDLVRHAREHFAREEEAMRRTAFPPYPIHRAEHERYLREADDRSAAWRQRRDLDALEDYLHRHVPAWWIHHVATMDRVTAQYIGNQEV